MKAGKQVAWHSLFWVAIVSFFSLVIHGNSKMGWEETAIVFVGFGIINIGLFYLNLLVYIPFFFNRKKFGQYALVVLVTLILLGFGKYGIALTFRSYLLITERGKVITMGFYMLNTVLTGLTFIFFSVLLKFGTDWFTNERIQRDLENQRLTAELSFLKSQVNPHFLFNSLNTIYSLAYQRSETTPEAVLKLSEIMRYMLYESNDNKVELDKELKYLENYIELQKIRYGQKAFIEYTVEGAITSQQIVPLILISFVENAFKHGIVNDPQHPIFIRLTVTDSHLTFYVFNKKHAHNRDAVGGIGLNNVQRRLKLLYPGRYQLDIENGDDTYSSELSLVL
ncbi:sensor histidine kinase [Mucilaginibacter ginkgonis]|uniref:Histidine kinase n=1 Tax=Mucilaginibacter ginkgonis TaxID=2682091 RepID=A0A6I4HYB0_9SPHI|nr:histidine kinase [Mucilaginibacter ginkgonis]QQL49663.1 histidine kinase [Mucilaginibacter ginkgonis]